MTHNYKHIHATVRKEIEAAILARLAFSRIDPLS